MWPNVGIKSCNNFSSSCPKCRNGSFDLKSDALKIAQKVTKISNLFSIKVPPRSFKNSPIWSHWIQSNSFLLDADTIKVNINIQFVFLRSFSHGSCSFARFHLLKFIFWERERERERERENELRSFLKWSLFHLLVVFSNKQYLFYNKFMFQVILLIYTNQSEFGIW